MGTGLAVVNSNLLLSPLQGREPAAEAGLVLYGWVSRPCRASGRGMGRVGALGPTRACGGSSTCGARDRECVRRWGSRARGMGGGVLRRGASAPAHRLLGLRCAWDTRWPTGLSERVQRASECGRRTRTDTKGECVGLLPPGAALDAQGDSGESWALWRCLHRPSGNRPGISVARRVGEGEPIGIPELLPRQPFGHLERPLLQMEDSSVAPKGSTVLF